MKTYKILILEDDLETFTKNLSAEIKDFLIQK